MCTPFENSTTRIAILSTEQVFFFLFAICIFSAKEILCSWMKFDRQSKCSHDCSLSQNLEGGGDHSLRFWQMIHLYFNRGQIMPTTLLLALPPGFLHLPMALMLRIEMQARHLKNGLKWEYVLDKRVLKYTSLFISHYVTTLFQNPAYLVFNH